MAIGQNEDAAAVLGVPTPRYKALVYSISAFLPAIAGGLYFFKSGIIEPGGAFDLELSIEAIVMVMLGGAGTVIGPALGAFLYEELRGLLLTAEAFSHFQLVIAGALLLLIVLFVPGGLMGFIHRRWPRMREVARMTVLLEVTRLSKRFGGVQAVLDLSFTVDEGEIVGLIGPNGAGKSTVFNLINGVSPPDTGRVLFEGHDMTGNKPWRDRSPRPRARAPDRAAAHRADRVRELHRRRLLRARESVARARPRNSARRC